jgi:hypothetical protein
MAINWEGKSNGLFRAIKVYSIHAEHKGDPNCRSQSRKMRLRFRPPKAMRLPCGFSLATLLIDISDADPDQDDWDGIR